MINTFIGDLGHVSVIVAFVAAIVSALSYFMASKGKPLGDTDINWRNLGRGAFYVHTLAVLSIIFSLFNIIYNHRYEYYYAWSHSSNFLPTHFMISCFWEGQEGSFLLWIFWHTLLGLAIIWFNKKWEAPTMAVFAFVQLFLTSMILGIVIGDLKIGSSPFILLRDFMTDAPVFKLNPNFIPKDGTGLNPLLQNYWMVIHPPTLFLGFAITLVPFAFAIAALWKREYTTWVKPALPWGLFGGLILGVGIMMGAYWAYETLNFGGYWNWDPVENAVYIPWLVLMAGIHTLVIYKRSKHALRTSFILVITTFLLILYATFLTRSGILGNASVHSFTDLGLSGQLFTYLAAFVVLAVILLVLRWKNIPATEKELTTYNPEFWVFIGAAVLCLGSFQVLVTTSIPVYNSFLGFIGIKSNVALPADQIAHYTKFQLWLGVGIAILTGLAQLMWWQKNDKSKIANALALPLILSVLFVALVFLLGKIGLIPQVNTVSYFVLLLVSVFAIIANLIMVITLIRRKANLSGGAISHIGVALMLFGILFSAGYSNVISQNTSGLLYSRDFPDDINRDNVLLFRNEKVKMGPYDVAYRGQYFEVKGFPEYVNKQLLFRTDEEHLALARTDLKHKDKVYFKTGDTVQIYPENTYYQVEFKDPERGEEFILYPRAQVNPEMGFIASPAIKMFFRNDLYTQVSAVTNNEEEKEWGKLTEYDLAIGDTLFLNDYVAILKDIEPTREVKGVQLAEGDVAVQADFKISGEEKDYHAHPVFVIKDNLVGRIPDEVEDLGLRLSFLNIDTKNNKFKIGVNTTQKDYVILKATEKPFINILWIGTVVMAIGMSMAIVKRYRETKTTVNTDAGNSKKRAVRNKQVA
ncbi:MAG: Cytochrome c heme lyase subunit CcmF [uncultured Adhaeribacter sp.]|uniref:Cytochrome c heme lyase subunit CcmF n=1 Tax=uncultured Adhaeribacter sp. TaxID=448109 RepID=A0A6J4HYD8_9BACT|nr:MAG: Cytochrome c heme lyase subunit CcmF [uncultured Adhaeribacter sp.]